MWNGRKIDILEHTQKGKKKEGVGGIFFKTFAKKNQSNYSSCFYNDVSHKSISLIC